ncbi:TIGR03084 family metal-binding protein [Nocardia macrotermitis]|nr:TIGR03084 family metal-binding protein [Nocardia macrotermitis]
MVDVAALLEDLAAECADLDRIVAALPAADWSRDTPATGWTIAHQIGHLTWTDEVATRSATDAAAFGELVRTALPRAATFVDEAAVEAAAAPPDELLARWRRGREAFGNALLAVPAGTKLSWFGPPMSPASMISARLMETWAHGQDIADTLGVTRTPTARLRTIAHIGVRTRNFAYAVNELAVPAEEFRIELTAPDGTVWSWGPEAASQRVTGPAVDFCLRVTQRRHPDDLALTATGADARQWLRIAQAFAGPTGSGRAAGQFA